MEFSSKPDIRSIFYRYLIHPGLFILEKLWLLPPEEAHKRVASMLHSAELDEKSLGKFQKKWAHRGERFTHERLRMSFGGIAFDVPYITAAGTDKNGLNALAFHELGYEGSIVGTVTLEPQDGNPHSWFDPRQAMVTLDIIWNYLGLNNDGAIAVASNIKPYHQMGLKIGASIGKNRWVLNEHAAEHTAQTARVLLPFVDFFEYNVSTPNTKDIRQQQRRGFLYDCLKAVCNVMKEDGKVVPLVPKFASDTLKQQVEDGSNKRVVDEVIETLYDTGVNFMSLTNTTSSAEIKAKYGGRKWANAEGGFSGNIPELRRDMLELTAYIHRETKGQIQTMCCGGNYSASDCIESHLAGGTINQVCSGHRIKGPTLPGEVARGEAEYCMKNNVSIPEIIGANAHKIPANFRN